MRKNIGPSATRENFSMEKAAIHGTKVRVQEVIMLLFPLSQPSSAVHALPVHPVDDN